MAFHGEYDWRDLLDEGVEHDPQVDEGVKVRCVNPSCDMMWPVNLFEGEEGYWWYPPTVTEYQGVRPHGGLVNFYADNSHDCPECGQEGEEF